MIRPSASFVSAAVFASLALSTGASAFESREFSLGLAGAMALPAAQDGTPVTPGSDDQVEPELATEVVPGFGDKGSAWWSITGSGMVDDGSENKDFSLRLSYHNFLAKDFELNLALTGWYHDQPDTEEWSGSFDLGFRYHFLNKREEGWSGYIDTGIGFMLSSDEVPEGGTDYNFTPRAGAGLTLRLPDNLGGDAGARLDIGVGWQHYSNASTSGSDDNPARDSVYLRAGVIFPF